MNQDSYKEPFQAPYKAPYQTPYQDPYQYRYPEEDMNPYPVATAGYDPPGAVDPPIPLGAFTSDDGFLSLFGSPVASAFHEHVIPFAGGMALHPGGIIALSIVGGIAAAAALIALCALLARFLKLLFIRPASGLFLSPFAAFAAAAVKPAATAAAASAASGLKPILLKPILKKPLKAAAHLAALLKPILKPVLKPALVNNPLLKPIANLKPVVAVVEPIGGVIVKPVDVTIVKPIDVVTASKPIKPIGLSVGLETNVAIGLGDTKPVAVPQLIIPTSTVDKVVSIDASKPVLDIDVRKPDVSLITEQERAASVHLIPLAQRVLDNITQFNEKYNINSS